MVSTATVAPPNSIILIADKEGGEIPRSIAGELVAATDSCIAVGCCSEFDGKTEIILGGIEEVAGNENPVFVGELKTPTYEVVVRSVLGYLILEKLVSRPVSYITIWANDSSEPNQIIIGVK